MGIGSVSSERVAVGPTDTADEIAAAVRDWVDQYVPAPWREAAADGAAALRAVRSIDDYTTWYPVFGRSGLVVPTWPVAYGGLDLPGPLAKVVDAELRPYNLGRLNALGLNQAAHALFNHGTEEQRLRFLPPIVRNEEVWCQLFSEPGAGSDLASLACRAVRDGDEWIVSGQKIWTTWAHLADFAVLIARTDPDAPKHKGITFFMIDMHQPGIEVRPLYDMRDAVDVNEVFLDEARVPDSYRVGELGEGWRVANSALSGERQMVAGSGSGGVDRIGGSGIDQIIVLAKERGVAADPTVRQSLMSLYSEDKVRRWTNDRVRATLKAGLPPGPESSVGKVHQAALNQRMQTFAVQLLGAEATAWASAEKRYGTSLPPVVKGMLRSVANTIEGGTTEVNKNILGERVLGLPREPDPWRGAPWRETPRS